MSATRTRRAPRIHKGQHVHYPTSYPSHLVKGVVWRLDSVSVVVAALDGSRNEYQMPVSQIDTLRPWTSADEAEWHRQMRNR